MMKEYLCSNFLAEQILNEVAPAHFQSRLGYAASEMGRYIPTMQKPIFTIIALFSHVHVIR